MGAEVWSGLVGWFFLANAKAFAKGFGYFSSFGCPRSSKNFPLAGGPMVLLLSPAQRIPILNFYQSFWKENLYRWCCLFSSLLLLYFTTCLNVSVFFVFMSCLCLGSGAAAEHVREARRAVRRFGWILQKWRERCLRISNVAWFLVILRILVWCWCWCFFGFTAGITWFYFLLFLFMFTVFLNTFITSSLAFLFLERWLQELTEVFDRFWLFDSKLFWRMEGSKVSHTHVDGLCFEKP